MRQNLPEELSETSYTLQIDNRLGQIVSRQGSTIPLDYIDDDNIAYYTVDLGDGAVFPITSRANSVKQVIAGPRGTRLEFKIAASVDLNTSAFLFTRLGSTTTMPNRGGGDTEVYYIDSQVRVTGVKTGYALDIPVRFVKFKTKIS